MHSCTISPRVCASTGIITPHISSQNTTKRTQQYWNRKCKLINIYLSIFSTHARTQARTVSNTTDTKIDTQHLNLRHGHENYVMHSRQCTHRGILISYFVSPSSNYSNSSNIAADRVLPPRS